ncbi:MAG: class I SAM-dependent methyltransferase [Planctomycetota bacterium]
MAKFLKTTLAGKSTVDAIRRRFDADVDRFSVLDTGQSATLDAPLAMELIGLAAIASTSPIRRVLDIGCGAGNNTLRLHQLCGHDFAVDLLDLSRPMIERASTRLNAAGIDAIQTWHADFRDAALPESTFDVILAAAVLHHLRDDTDWEHAFGKIFRLLAPGGSVWITDLVSQETEGVAEIMWDRYGRYLREFGGDAFRERVFEYIDQEDSPRPVTYQLTLLKRVGFESVELLHKNSCFAAFGATKAP